MDPDIMGEFGMEGGTQEILLPHHHRFTPKGGDNFCFLSYLENLRSPDKNGMKGVLIKG
jgi:hypothetical protein